MLLLIFPIFINIYFTNNYISHYYFIEKKINNKKEKVDLKSDSILIDYENEHKLQTKYFGKNKYPFQNFQSENQAYKTKTICTFLNIDSNIDEYQLIFDYRLKPQNPNFITNIYIYNNEGILIHKSDYKLNNKYTRDDILQIPEYENAEICKVELIFNDNDYFILNKIILKSVNTFKLYITIFTLLILSLILYSFIYHSNFNNLIQKLNVFYSKNEMICKVVLSSFIFFILALHTIVDLKEEAIKWCDSAVLIKRAYFPIFSLNFLTDYKPFTLDLLYRITGVENLSNIIILQKLILTLSSVFLGFSISLFIKNRILSLLSIIIFSTLALWWNIIEWTYVILTESFSISFLFLWIGSLLLFIKKRNVYSLVILCIITFFFSFTRDNHPFLILTVVGIFTGIMIISKFIQKKKVKLLLIFCIFSIIISISQFYCIKLGDRSVYNFLNVVLQRILPDKEKTKWFKENGMPINDELLQWKECKPSVDNYVIYRDPKYKDFMDCVRSNCNMIYAKYLVTHPCKTMNEYYNNTERIFTTNLRKYTHYEINSKSISLANSIWDIDLSFRLLLCIILAVMCLCISFFRKGERFYLFIPFVLLILTFVNSFLVYFSDTIELERHSLANGVLVNLLIYLSIFCLIDNVFGFIRKIKN